MKRSLLGRCVELLTCVAVAAAWLGCGELEEDSSSVASEATVCTNVSAGSPWWNRSFPSQAASQAGRFHVELTATPSAPNLDAVVGLGRGATSTWSQLAAIVRFNPAGLVDVRAGSTYRADVAYPYYADVTYFIRLDVDLRSRTYSVWLKTVANGSYEPIALDYPFRTEQASIDSLDNAAAYLEPSRPGSLTLCDLTVVQDDTTGDGCMIATAGGRFANAQLAGTTGVMMARLVARPSAAGIDAVIGFANGSVDAYNDLAASIRFYTNNRIEVRDGDVYRADQVVPYTAGTWYDVRAFIDLPSKTYSVIVGSTASGEYTELARGYRFRPQQQTVTGLDRAAAVISSATGRLDTCGMENVAPPALSLARAGTYFTLPLPGGQALISDDARTQRLDAAGATVAELPRGGMSAVDASGNIYLARASGDTLTVSSYTSGLALRWSRAYAATGPVTAVGVYATGELAVAVGEWSQPRQLIQIYASGTERLRRDLGQATAIAIGPSGYTLAYPLATGAAVEARRPDGSLLWQRTWTGSISVDHMARDPAAGVVFAGTFAGTVDFGDGPLEPFSNPDSSLNTFLVSLSPTGALRFSRHVYSTYPTGVASNGTRIAIASTAWTQMPYMELRAFDSTGDLVWTYGGVYEELGFTGAVAVGSTGRIYANMSPKFYPGALAPPWPFLLGFDP
jgi:hypothetical protein